MSAVGYEAVRLLNTRPYGLMLRQIAQGHRASVEQRVAEMSGKFKLKEISALSDDLLAARVMSVHFASYISAREMTPASYTAYLDELEIVKALFAFSRFGRHIVQFDDGLTSEFSRTELVGMTTSDLILPWDSFYVAFTGIHCCRTDNFPFNGVVVALDNNRRELNLTPLWNDLSGWVTQRQLQTVTIKVDLNEETDLLSAFQKSAVQYDALTSMLNTSHFPTCYSHFVEEVRALRQPAAPKIERIARLIGNSLLYLSARPGDGNTVWEAIAPAELVVKANSQAPGSKKAAQMLISSGYTTIRLISLPTKDNVTSTGSNVRAHWRSGHWKRQPYGPKASLRKLVRIRPMLVGGSASVANEYGTVHLARAGDRPRKR